MSHSFTQAHTLRRPARKITTPLLVALVAATLIASFLLSEIVSRGPTFANAAPSSPSSASAYVGETDMGPLEFFKRSAPSGKKSTNRVEPPTSNGGDGNRNPNESNQGRKMQEGSNRGGNNGSRGGNNGNATCNNVGSLERQVADLKNDMTRLTQLVEQMARQLSTCNLCQNGENQGQNRGGGGNGRGRNMKDGNQNRNHGRKGGKRGGGSNKHQRKGRGRKGSNNGGHRSGKSNNNSGGNQNGGGQQMPPSKTVVVTAITSNIGTAPVAVGGGVATMAVMEEAEE